MGLVPTLELDDVVGGVLVSGQGPGAHGTALETALTLEETNLRPARSRPYVNLRCGPFAGVTESMAVVLVSAIHRPLVADRAGLPEELRSADAATVGIGTAGFRSDCGTVLVGPDLPDGRPHRARRSGQLLAERLARHSGLDPEAPRGLTKVIQTDRGGTR